MNLANIKLYTNYTKIKNKLMKLKIKIIPPGGCKYTL